MKPKNKHAQALGRLGGKAGTGPAKARTSTQARSAALIRWHPALLRELADRPPCPAPIVSSTPNPNSP